MTALAAVYPLVTLRYFWEDWFRFLRWGNRVAIDAAGFVIQTTDGRLTQLTPWRLIDAAVTTGLLFSAARRLKQGAPGARAFSHLVLMGVLLPQVLWYGELSLDWFHGRGFLPLMLGGLAAVLLPSMALGNRERVVEGWGAPSEHRGRVLAAAVGLGWLGFGASAFLEHIHHFQQVGVSVAAALAAIPLAVVGMVGLYRQRAWGVVAAASSVGALTAFTAGLAGGYYSPSRGFVNTLAAIAGSPASVLAMTLPILVLMSLLGPFLAGFVRKLAGVEPIDAGADASAGGFAAIARRLRVDAPPQAPEAQAPAASDEALDDDEAALAEAERGEQGGGRKLGG